MSEKRPSVASLVRSCWHNFVPQGDGPLCLLAVGTLVPVVLLIVREAHGG